MDLAAMSSIQDVVKTFLEQYDHLDQLANNAGPIFNSYCETKDGHEMMFDFNHLDRYLLTELLPDVLKRSAPSRVVCVSSIGHVVLAKEQPTVDVDDSK